MTTSNDSSFFASRQGRHLSILGGLALVLVIAAFWAVSSSRDAARSDFEPFPFFPDLEKQAEDLAEVTITSQDDGVIRLLLSEDRTKWIAPDKNNFPVKTDELRGLLVDLLNAEAVEEKTARSDWHELLGLEDPVSEGDGVRVQLKNSKGEMFGDLIVGNNVGAGAVGADGARFVRRGGEDQTYVARGDLSVKRELNDWIVRDVIDLFRERVAKVSVTPLDGPAYTLTRATPQDENFTLPSIPEGREILSETTPNQLGSALANVKFDDVRPAGDFDFSKGAQIVYETFDGLKITLAALQIAEDHWISVSADLLPVDVTPSSDGEATDAPDPASGLKSREEVEAEAAQIASYTNGWAFQIPSWKGDAFQRDLESMLKPLPSETDGVVEDAP